jgi:ferredoxin-NADP reductase
LIVQPSPIPWVSAEVLDVAAETPRVKTIRLAVPDWRGHMPGQHVDVRLTAEDGYQAERSYSIASPPGERSIALTVERLDDGEVSPFLTEELRAGDQIELRGPLGGYFTWTVEQGGPLALVAGGSGVVPLMAMIRTREAAGNKAPFRLVYSVRSPDTELYKAELAERQRRGDGLDVTYVYTRTTPPGWPAPPGRINAGVLASAGWPPDRHPAVFVCGPTPFVEAVANLLVNAGHDPRLIKTERFGPTGGKS